eukprot:scaffold29301_cov52-Phaeocystis_antarctica.AAC.2
MQATQCAGTLALPTSLSAHVLYNVIRGDVALHLDVFTLFPQASETNLAFKVQNILRWAAGAELAQYRLPVSINRKSNVWS